MCARQETHLRIGDLVQRLVQRLAEAQQAPNRYRGDNQVVETYTIRATRRKSTLQSERKTVPHFAYLNNKNTCGKERLLFAPKRPAFETHALTTK